MSADTLYSTVLTLEAAWHEAERRARVAYAQGGNAAGIAADRKAHRANIAWKRAVDRWALEAGTDPVAYRYRVMATEAA